MTTLKGRPGEALYLMALLLGLRRGEVLGPLIENIDWERELVKDEHVWARPR